MPSTAGRFGCAPAPSGRAPSAALRSACLCAVLAAAAAPARAADVFINELHYDNEGSDRGEAVEVAGPAGTDLTGWRITLYNGSDGRTYDSRALAGVIPDQQSGYGTLAFAFPSNGIQNGSPDGLALSDASGRLVQLRSYEGSFVAADGPAAGEPSVDIGVSEDGATAAGSSLQLRGRGREPADFTWGGPLAASFGAPNAGQTLGGPPPATLSIPEIQGAGHVSAYAGWNVITTGVVTAVLGYGFFLQDPAGDADPATSDGIFAFTGAAPEVSAGDRVEVRGLVHEFVPDFGSHELSVTELANTAVLRVLSAGGPLPEATPIGGGGRAPPTEVVDDDRLAAFEPARDGIDFYESLEGVRVRLADAVAVAPENRFGEVLVLVDGGAGATGRNARGGITVRAGDLNPERIQVQLEREVPPGASEALRLGDRLGDVVGVMGYSFGSFEVVAAAPFDVEPAGLAPETTRLGARPSSLRIATYNAHNLHPGDTDRFQSIAGQIVGALGSPDVIALQEIQDNDGPADTGTVDAGETWQALIDAVLAASGPRYAFRDLPPRDGQDGGQPGGNIRVGYLLNAERVRVRPGSLSRIPDPDLSDGDAFAGSRKPLEIAIEAGGERIVLINNHLRSRGGSSPLFGSLQPPVIGGAEARAAQAAVVRARVEAIRAADPGAGVVVLGDLNELPFGEPLEILRGAGEPVLVDLVRRLPASERYSYLFEGNAQQLDYILATPELAARAAVDIVHANAELRGAPSDHDPVVARIALPEASRPAQLAAALATLFALKAAGARRGAGTVVNRSPLGPGPSGVQKASLSR